MYFLRMYTDHSRCRRFHGCRQTQLRRSPFDFDISYVFFANVAVCSSVLRCIASVLQCAAVSCSVLQCVAVCCSVLQCVDFDISYVFFACVYRSFTLLYTTLLWNVNMYSNIDMYLEYLCCCRQTQLRRRQRCQDAADSDMYCKYVLKC